MDESHSLSCVDVLMGHFISWCRYLSSTIVMTYTLYAHPFLIRLLLMLSLSLLASASFKWPFRRLYHIVLYYIRAPVCYHPQHHGHQDMPLSIVAAAGSPRHNKSNIFIQARPSKMIHDNSSLSWRSRSSHKRRLCSEDIIRIWIYPIQRRP
jgi:hypothetical protein